GNGRLKIRPTQSRRADRNETGPTNLRADKNIPLSAERSPIPLYHRLHVILRERIVSGTYRPGDLVPAEAELMARFGVSRITAKRALDELSAEGLVERGRGRGATGTPAGA